MTSRERVSDDLSAEVLRAVISVIREYPDFDTPGPLTEMMDDALAGRVPKLLEDLRDISNGIRPSRAADRDAGPVAWNLIDRAVKMMEMAGYRVAAVEPNHNNPIIAWMADARQYLAHPAPAADQVWQPIETAPKDGSHIQLYRPEIQFVGYWGGHEWIINAGGLPIMFPPPTQWQSLPQPPAIEPSEGRK
jgi:hypothetical protein